MKKIKIILYSIASFFFFTFFIVFLPGKNQKEYIACFETRQLAYRSFRNISHLPKLFTSLHLIKAYPKGLWLIPAKSSFFDLYKIFRANKKYDDTMRITFIEGMNSFQITALINNNENFSQDLARQNLVKQNLTRQDSGRKNLIKQNLTGQNFIKQDLIESIKENSTEEHIIEEGSIFPDTYFFKKNTPRILIIQKAQKLMDQKINLLWEPIEQKAKNFNIKLPINKKEFVILASIVQKEGLYYEDFCTIASCFLLRMQIGVRLHSDVTVLYGLKIKKRELLRNNNKIINTKILEKNDHILLFKDIKIKTPYNTYLIERLPIKPICMPGACAMQAIIDVLDSAMNYTIKQTKSKKHKIIKKLIYKNAPLYFYACNGKILYANHLSEHIKNKNMCKIK